MKKEKEIKQQISLPANIIFSYKKDKEIFAAVVGYEIEEEPSLFYHNLSVYKSLGEHLQRKIYSEFIEFLKKKGIRTIAGNILFLNLEKAIYFDNFSVFERCCMKLERDVYNNYTKKFLSENMKEEVKNKEKEMDMKIVQIKEFKVKKLGEFDSLVYSSADFIDSIALLAKNHPKFCTFVVQSITSGDFGKYNSKCSLAIKKNKKPIGLILCIDSKKKEGFIMDVGVHPHYQGKGLGKLLLSIVMKRYFDELKYDSIELAVSKTNQRAKNIYEKLGFTTYSIFYEFNYEIENFNNE